MTVLEITHQQQEFITHAVVQQALSSVYSYRKHSYLHSTLLSIMAVSISKKKSTPTHPPCIDMIVAAITNLKEKKGSSVQAIKKYIAANFSADMDKLATHIKKAFITGVASGKLVQTKGKGASGSFKLNAKTVDTKEKKAKEAAKKKAQKEKEAAKIKAKKEKLAAKKQAAKEKASVKKSAPKKKSTTKKPKKAEAAKKKTAPKKTAAPKKKAAAAAKKTPTKKSKPSKKVAAKKKPVAKKAAKKTK